MNYTLDQLVDIITREVLKAYPAGGQLCSGCGQACDGNCAATCPERCREVVQAGADRLSGRLGAGQVPADLARMIDHTLLKPDASRDEISKLCSEARANNFATVCVNPAWVALCADLLRGSPVKVCTVVGFPLGATLPEVKAFETERAIAGGASEIDMVQNIGALKSRDYKLVGRGRGGRGARSPRPPGQRQGDHRGRAADRRGEGGKLRHRPGRRRGLCQNVHRLRLGRRHGGRRGPDAPGGRARVSASRRPAASARPRTPRL